MNTKELVKQKLMEFLSDESKRNKLRQKALEVAKEIVDKNITGSQAMSYVKQRLPLIQTLREQIWKQYSERLLEHIDCSDMPKHAGKYHIRKDTSQLFSMLDLLLLMAEGIFLPEELPICRYCNKNRVIPALSNEFATSIRRLVYYVQAKTDEERHQRFRELYSRCACKYCYGQHMYEQHKLSLKQKYGVENVNQLEEVRQIKSKKLSEYYSKHREATVAKADLRLQKTGKVWPNESDETTERRKILCQVLGIELSHSKLLEKALELLNRLNKEPEKLSAHFRVLQDFRSIADVQDLIVDKPDRDNRLRCKCLNCGYEYSIYVSGLVWWLYLYYVENVGLDYIFGCPNCFRSTRSLVEGRLASLIERKLEELELKDKVYIETNPRLVTLYKAENIDLAKTPVSIDLLQKQEVDIAILRKDSGKLLLGIEIDGIFWHSTYSLIIKQIDFETFRQEFLHRRHKLESKLKALEKLKHHTLFITDALVNNETDKVLGYIGNRLLLAAIVEGLIDQSYMQVYNARDLVLETVDKTTAETFYGQYHLYPPSQQILNQSMHIAFIDKETDSIIAMATITPLASRPIKSNSKVDIELTRMVFKYGIRIKGAFDKLTSWLKKQGYKTLKTYVDMRLSQFDQNALQRLGNKYGSYVRTQYITYDIIVPISRNIVDRFAIYSRQKARQFVDKYGLTELECAYRGMFGIFLRPGTYSFVRRLN